MAAAAAVEHLRGSISGCYPLSHPKRGPDREEGGIHRHWDRPGRKEVCPWDVGRRKRERQVLGRRAEQPEKPRCKGHVHRLYG